jgi:hypothetical protein
LPADCAAPWCCPKFTNYLLKKENRPKWRECNPDIYPKFAYTLKCNVVDWKGICKPVDTLFKAMLAKIMPNPF